MFITVMFNMLESGQGEVYCFMLAASICAVIHLVYNLCVAQVIIQPVSQLVWLH